MTGTEKKNNLHGHGSITGLSGMDARSTAEAAWLLWATYRQRCSHDALVYIQEGGVTTPRGRL